MSKDHFLSFIDELIEELIAERRKKHHHLRVLFTVGRYSYTLRPQEKDLVMATLTLGQSLPLSIAFLDQNGHPIAVTPDSPPAWTDASGDLTVAADGLTASLKPTVAGTEVVDLTVVVGGKTFTATLDVTIEAPAPVLTSVQIVAGTPA